MNKVLELLRNELRKGDYRNPYLYHAVHALERTAEYEEEVLANTIIHLAQALEKNQEYLYEVSSRLPQPLQRFK